MPGNSSTQTTRQSSQSQPWAPAQPALYGILGQLGQQLGKVDPTAVETGALDALARNAQGGNPYAPQIGALAGDLLAGGPDRSGGISDAYDVYQNSLTPFARGDYVDPASNPALQPYLDTIRDKASNSVNAMFAGAGRDLSPAHVRTLAEGIAQGQAPVMFDAYNRGVAGQRSAIDALHAAGGQQASLLSHLDRLRFGNRQAGIGAADAAWQANNKAYNELLAVEARRRGIPLDTLRNLSAMAAPLAALGSSSSGESTTTKESPFNPLSLLPLALSFIPGVGPILGPASSMLLKPPPG